MVPPFRPLTRGYRKGLGGTKRPYRHHERAHTILKTKMRVYIYIYTFSQFQGDRRIFYPQPMVDKWFLDMIHPLWSTLSPSIIPNQKIRLNVVNRLYIDWLFHHPLPGYPISDQLSPPPYHLYFSSLYIYPIADHIPVHYTFPHQQIRSDYRLLREEPIIINYTVTPIIIPFISTIIVILQEQTLLQFISIPIPFMILSPIVTIPYSSSLFISPSADPIPVYYTSPHWQIGLDYRQIKRRSYYYLLYCDPPPADPL